MKIVVTGARGFIGSILVRALAVAGHEVVALARQESEPVQVDGRESVKWIRADLGARDWDPSDTLPASADAVIHLAQSKGYRDFPDEASDIFEVNTAATFKLLNYARKVGASHFIYASSGSVYTGMTDPVLSEEKPISPANFAEHPLGFYCATKLCGEALVETFRTQIPSVASLRIFAPYGPGGGASLINRLVARVVAGETIQIQGNPGLTFNPIHVNDVQSAIMKILGLRQPIGILNLAGSEEVNLTDIVKMVGELIGLEPEIEYVSNEPKRGPQLIGEMEQMVSILGPPIVPIQEGINQIVNQSILS